MIRGIGIDVIRTARVKRAMERTPGFEDRIFSSEEIAYCRSQARPEQHFAARFAAKEAVMKALGTGWSGGIRFQDIVITREISGSPRVVIRSPSRELIPDIDRICIWISLSHDRETCAAVAIIETTET